MKKKDDNLGRKRCLRRKIGKRLLAVICVIGLGAADIGKVSAMESASFYAAASMEQSTEFVESEQEAAKSQLELTALQEAEESQLKAAAVEETEERQSESAAVEQAEESRSESEAQEETKESQSESEAQEETEGDKSDPSAEQQTEKESQVESTDSQETAEPSVDPSASSETELEVVTAPGEPVLKSAVFLEDYVTVEWEPVDGAEGYRVYRKIKSGSWNRIAEVGAEVTSWKDSGLARGEYIYTVRAFVMDQGEYLLSTYNKSGISVKVVTAPEEPALKSASSSSYTSVNVKWKAADGAEGYRLYRKVKGGSWKRIAEVDAKTTSWKDTGLTCGQKYIYTVRAFAKNQGKYLLSTYNKKGLTVTPVPAAPSLESMESASSSVTINWKKVDGATCYYVYRKESGGKWKRLASVAKDKTSYQDKTASKGVKYIYTVKGMHNDIKGKYDSKGIEGAVQVQSITLKSIYISSGGTAKVKWTKRSGADGYYVYRKEAGGKWQRLAAVSSDTSSWSEKGLDSDGNYIYTVVGYMTLNGKKVKGCVNSAGIAPKLEYTGNYVRNVTKTYLGTSGEGRKMYSYTIGSGKNHIVITMAIHAWEDEWNKDGAVLVKTGEQLIRTAAGKTSVLKEKDYSIIIIPLGNPDGLYSGTTCNGPGRCTTYRYNSDGKLVKGGVDLNRCFPTGFSAQYGTRNYTGAKPLMAKEAAILKTFVDSNKGSGKNIYIDAHGWYNQTITPRSGSGSVYSAFKKYFSGTRAASLGNGYGYISAYAGSKGYDTVLFEFPNVSSESQFTKNGYATKYINTVFYMVNNIK